MQAMRETSGISSGVIQWKVRLLRLPIHFQIKNPKVYILNSGYDHRHREWECNVQKKMQVAFLVIKSSRRLPNTSVDFLLRNVVMTERTKTAKVVVLIPPAVEPGATDQHHTDNQKTASLSQSWQVDTVEPGCSCTDRLKADSATCSESVRSW